MFLCVGCDHPMKWCPACEQQKPTEAFGRNASRKDGLAAYCTDCSRAKSRDYVATRPEVRESRRAYLANLYQNEPDRYLNYRYTARFGISLARYEEILESQDGACAICRFVPEPGRPRLAVDHDHACCPGKKSCGTCVRGLLCGDCNRAVGLLRDDPEAIRRAASYLESFPVHAAQRRA